MVWRPGSLASGASSVDISPWNCGGEGGEVFSGPKETIRLEARQPLDEWCISSHGPGAFPRVSSMPSREELWLEALSLGLDPVGVSLTSSGGVRPGTPWRPTTSAPHLLRSGGPERPLNGAECSPSSTTTHCHPFYPPQKPGPRNQNVQCPEVPGEGG